MSSAPTRSRATNRLALILASLAAAGFYAAAYLHHPHRPGGGGAASNQDWWAIGWDQPRYLRAALAWAAGNLDPAEHWYLPGYALLAAPFVHVTPADPFLLPNLALLLASLLGVLLTSVLDDEQLQAYGWRIAFGIGGVLGFVGMYLRRSLVETDQFEENAEKARGLWRFVLDVS